MGTNFEIHEACLVNNLSRVKELLDIGVNPNLVDPDSFATPLIIAVIYDLSLLLSFFFLTGK